MAENAFLDLAPESTSTDNAFSDLAPVAEAAVDVAPDAEQEQETPMESTPPPEMPAGTWRDMIEEPIFSIGSNIAGQIASGLSGAAVAPFAGIEEATGVIEDIQQGVAEFTKPTTQAGQKGVETVGDLIEAGVDIANIPISGLMGIGELIAGQGAEQAAKTVKDVQEKGFGATLGARVFEESGSPLMATVAETTPEILGSLVPITRMAKNRSKLNDELAKRIESGDSNNELAKYIVDGSGKVKADPIAKSAISQGFDQGMISAAKGSSDANKVKLLKMLDIKKRGTQNTLYAVKNRASDVAGDSLLERVNYVKQVNKDAGKAVDTQAKLLKGRQVNFDEPINNFIDSLDEMGVSISDDLKPIFKGSDVEGLKAPENAITNIVNRLSSGKRGSVPDAYELHRLKKYIDEIVTFGKAGEGLGGKVERNLKKLRSDIDNVLDTNFTNYDNANSVYADTISSLDALQDVAGRKMDLSGANADKAVGTLLRRMMSNAQSRINLVDAVDNLEGVAKKYGASFDDDIATQMLFADDLDSVFGASAKTSFKGEVAKGVQHGIDAATANKSALGKVADIARKGKDRVLGNDEAKAFRTLKEMLERKPDEWER